MNYFARQIFRYFLSLSLVLSVLLMILFTSEVAANSVESEKPSNSETKKFVQKYLELINSGDLETIKSFVSGTFAPSLLNRFSGEQVAQFHLSFYYMSGGMGYDFHSMLQSNPGKFDALVYNKLTQTWLKFTIPISDSLVTSLPQMVLTTNPEGEDKQTKFTQVEIIEKLDLCLQLMIRDDEFSGAILIAENDNVFFKKAYGLASKSYHVPNRTDTKFNIASVGKMFTGVATAQLVEQGKLSFDDPVGKYIPEGWMDPEAAEKIKIKHLLTHTSGYGTYFRKMYTQIQHPFFSEIPHYKILIEDEAPAFEPGTKWSYSNTGMVLLGLVIENISGMDYYSFVKEKVYQPAGMINTDAFFKNRPLDNRATGYTKEYIANEPVWTTSVFTRELRGGPSGGNYSTVEDLYKFGMALKNHILLSEEFTDLVLSPKPEINSPFYGYGFYASNGEFGRIAEHGGDGTGVNAVFRMYLDMDYTVIVLSNYNRPAANTVVDMIHQMLAR